MKNVLGYIVQTTLTGLALFVPVVVIIIVAIKLLNYLAQIVTPFFFSINQFFGIQGSPTWVGITLLLLIFFIGGLLLRIKKLKEVIGRWDDRILGLFPGYRMVKSLTRIQDSSDDVLMKPAMFKDNECWQPCFLVEEREGLSTIYIPEAPNVNAGDIKIVPSTYVESLPISNIDMTMLIRDYGLGAIKWIDQKRNTNGI